MFPFSYPQKKFRLLIMKNLRLRFPTLFTFLMLYLAVTAHAQQEVLYSQYMFNTLAINPAYAGNRDVLSLSAMGRYQWIGVPGSPTTYSLTIDSPLKNEKMGLGLVAFNDAIGHAKNTGISVVYSYKVRIGEKSTLSLGVQPSVTSINWRLSNVANGGLDPVFDASNDINRLYPNVGGGLYISGDRSYFGVSVPQIIEQKLNAFSTTESSSDIRTRRHYYAMMGFVVGKGGFKVKPSMLVRYTDGAPLGFDGNVNFWIRDTFSFGISGRKSQPTLSGSNVMDAVVGMLELQLTPQLRIGYAYDVNMTKINGNRAFMGTPTHEGLLRYEFGFSKNKVLSPRYF